ncbi:MAG: tail fiber domain-containing protein [Blautia sp.]|nr:tail fiber domain-containing protein [Blautia sp.]
MISHGSITITDVISGIRVDGTHTAATSTFKGNINVAELTDGLEISYWLPYGYTGQGISYTPTGGQETFGAVLNLTLSDGTTVSSPIFYSGLERFKGQCQPGGIMHMTYRVNKAIDGATATGWWCDVSPEISIGGRNLALQSATAKTSGSSVDGSAYTGSYYYSDYGMSLMTGNTDDLFTLSFDYEVTGNSADTARIYVQVNGGQVNNTLEDRNVYVINAPSGRYIRTVKLSSAQATYTDTFCSRMRLYQATDGAVLSVWNFKIEKGSKATDWTPAPEDVEADAQARADTAKAEAIAQAAEDTQTAINEMEIGGRNLLLDTDAPSLTKVAAGTNRIFSDGSNTSVVPEYISISDPPVNVSHGARFTVNTADGKYRGIRWYGTGSYIPLIDGWTYTASCYCRVTSGTKMRLRFRYGKGVYKWLEYIYIENTAWRRYSITFTYDGINFGDTDGTGTTFNFYCFASYVGAMEMCGFQLERGIKATDWQPAPEDVAHEISTAMMAADGKSAVFYQDTQPLVSGKVENDIWFDTANNNTMYRFHNGAWEKRQFGLKAIAAESIDTDQLVGRAVTAAKIATKTITANEIAAKAIITEKIDAGAVTAGAIAANAVTAEKIAAGSISGEKLVIGDYNNLCDLTTSNPDGYAILGTLPFDGYDNGYYYKDPIDNYQTANAAINLSVLKTNNLDVGDTIYCSFDAYRAGGASDTASIRLQMTFTDGSASQTLESAPVSLTTSVEKYEISLSPSDSNILNNIKYRFRFRADAGTNVRWYVRNIRIYRQSGTTMIKDGAITTNKIVARAITAAKIATETITANEIASNAITSAKIKAGEVKAVNLDAGAVTAEKIKAGAITASKLAVGTQSHIQCVSETSESSLDIIRSTFSDAVADRWSVTDGYLVANSAQLHFLTGVYDGSFSPGETLYYAFQGIAGSGSGDYIVRLRLFMYGPDNTTIIASINGGYHTLTPTLDTYSGTLTVSASASGNARYAIAIEGISPYPVYRIKGVSVYRQSGTTMIQDGAITTAKLTADAIKSTNYNGSVDATTAETYSTAGTFFDLNTGMIRSKNFLVTSNGDAYFKGSLAVGNGTLGGVNIGATSVYSGSKTAYNNANAGFFLGSDGKFGVGDSSQYIRFNGTNLDLKVKSLSVDGSPVVNASALNGQNLFLGTLYPVASPAKNRPRLKNSSGVGMSSGTATTAEHGIKITNTSAVRPVIRFGSNSTTSGTVQCFESGVTYSLSFDTTYKLLSGTTNTDSNYYLNVYFYYMTPVDTAYTSITLANIHVYSKSNTTDRGKTFTDHVEITFTVPDNVAACYMTINPSVSTASFYAAGDFIELRNLMLVKGSTPVPWSPAPEDMAGTATNYMYYDSTNGLVLSQTGVAQTGYNVQITNSALNVRNGASVLASYGDAVTLYHGISGKQALVLDSTNGVRMYKLNGSTLAAQLNADGLTVSSGKIGGFEINSTAIKTDGVAVTSNADNSIALSSADFTRTISGTSRSGLRFAIGDKFGITGDGKLYASSATLSGAITATSGAIGGWSINNGILSSVAFNNDPFVGEDIFIGEDQGNSCYYKAFLCSEISTNSSCWMYFKKSTDSIINPSAYPATGETLLFSLRADGSVFTNGYLKTNYGVILCEGTALYQMAGTIGNHRNGECIGNQIIKQVVSDTQSERILNIANNSYTRKIILNKATEVSGSLTVSTSLTLGTILTVGTHIYPSDDDNSYLGSSVKRFKAVYATNGTIQTSDERRKDIIGDLADYKNLFMALKPISFRWKEGSDNSIHFGIGAQTTERAMKSLGIKDLAMIRLEEGSYSAIYTELQMLTIPVVQDHEKRIRELEEELERLRRE